MKLLNEYTDKEKIEWFNKMYNEAHEQLRYIEEHGYERKDCVQHTWEVVMELIGISVWKRWNEANDE